MTYKPYYKKEVINMDTNDKKDYNKIIEDVKMKAKSIFRKFLKYIHEPDGKSLNYKKVGIISIGVLVLFSLIINLFGSGATLPEGYALPQDLIVEIDGESYYSYDGSADEYYKESEPDEDGYTPRYHISKIIDPDSYTKNQNTSASQAEWSFKIGDEMFNRTRKKSFLQNGE